jgi:hypothetical protein
MHRQHDHSARQKLGRQTPRCLDAVHPGHRDIEQYEVRLHPGSHLQRLVAITGLEDVRLVEYTLEQRTKTGPYQWMVVNYQ